MDLAQQLQTLYGQFGEHPGITIELQKELVAIGVRNSVAQATVFLQGAQIAEFTPHGEQPVLFMSAENRHREGVPLRGGIPICWPWFGDLQRNPEPIRTAFESDKAHGMARARMWQLDAVDTSDTACTQLTLTLPDAELKAEGLSGYGLQLQVRVGATLECRLITRNTGAATLHLSQALHTYFAVSDVRDIRISGLQESSYIDALDDWQEKTQQGDITITAETDRIYTQCPNRVALEDATWQRRLTLTSRHSHSMVVWNPWIEKAQRLSDFADDDYLTMMCLESANVMGDAIALPPGQSCELDVVIGVERLT